MLTRRAFLTTAAAAAACATTRSAFAIDPLKRVGATRMKLSLAAYSFRSVLSGANKSSANTLSANKAMTLEDFVDRAAAWDLDAVEPTSYYFPEPPTPEYCRRLRRRAFLNGLEISGTAVGNTFTHPPGPARDKEIAHVKRWVDLAAELHAPTIRIFAGNLPKGTQEEQARQWCIDAINECLDYAGPRGVFLALENHGGIVSTVDQLLSIVTAIKHDWFGVNWDSGNFRSADPYADLAKAAPYAVAAQIKSEISPNNVRQHADFARLVGILRQAAYSGYVALEYEAKEDPFVAVPRHLKELRRLISATS
jgi:sugar phosphate isomerase/epimerase